MTMSVLLSVRNAQRQSLSAGARCSAGLSALPATRACRSTLSHAVRANPTLVWSSSSPQQREHWQHRRSPSVFANCSHASGSRSARLNSTAAGAAPEGAGKLDEGEQKIFDLLKQRFAPTELKVQDVSGGCGSFYAILVSSKDFAGIPTVKAHRLVNETLKEVIPGIHGLQVKTIAE